MTWKCDTQYQLIITVSDDQMDIEIEHPNNSLRQCDLETESKVNISVIVIVDYDYDYNNYPIVQLLIGCKLLLQLPSSQRSKARTMIQGK